MLARGCPRADELEALATTGEGSARIKRHVGTCAACAKIVQGLRHDAQLLEEVREAVREGLDAETRAHVLQLAAEAAGSNAETPNPGAPGPNAET